MAYLGSWAIDDYLTIPAATQGVDGAAAAADGNVVLNIYEDDGTTQTVGPVNMTKSFDSITGANMYKVQLTAANGFEHGKSYTAWITATVGGVAGVCFHTFQIAADVTATATVAGTVTANVTQIDGVAVGTHASGMFPADVRDYLGSGCPAADTAGYPKVTVKSGTGTGEISMTAGVPAVNVTQWGGSAAGTLATTEDVWADATAPTRILTAPNNITADDGKIPSSAASGVTINPASVVASVTNTVSANVVSISGDSAAADNAESFFDGTGYAGTNNVIPSVTNVTNVTNVTGSVAGTVAGFPDNAIKGADLDQTAIDKIADGILDRALNASDPDALNARTVRSALRILRNKFTDVANTLTVYKEDDTTPAWTSALTRSAVNPVTASDPA